MFAAYQRAFQRRADLLQAERYDDFARSYQLPMTVDLAGLRLRVNAFDELAVHLRRHHLALRRRGVSHLRPEVFAIELPRAATHRVWVRWHDCGASDLDRRQSEVVYNVLPTDHGLVVAELGYLTLAMPEFSRAGTHRRLVS